jgi:predicted CXXCH cytochrome family protein
VVRPGFNNGGDAATLTNDHPIGMPVPTKNGYQPPVQLAGYLVASNVECSTCHAVHGANPLQANLLRISNTGSALCLDCHVK